MFTLLLTPSLTNVNRLLLLLFSMRYALSFILGLALITDHCKVIHDGNHSVPDLMDLGKRILGRRHVHPSVVGTLKQMQVEATFETGTHLITIHNPISTDDGDLSMALYGSFLPTPSTNLFPAINEADFHPLAIPGAVSPAKLGSIVLHPGRARISVTVTNRGTRGCYVSLLYSTVTVFLRL